MLQVSSNGLISFGNPFTSFNPQHFPIGINFAVVAPFWSDVDISNGVGNIYYHLYRDAQSPLVLHASEELTSFTGNFNSTWLMVVTWDGVPQFAGSLTEVSSLH